MKVTRLDIGFEYDFDLFGVSSSLKDYKLAWMLNNDLKIDLQRGNDYEIESSKGKKIVVPFYFHETDNSVVRMMRNKSQLDLPGTDYLVPELQHFDYFIMKEGLFMNENGAFMAALRRVKGVEYATVVDIGELKSRENFIF